MFLFSKKSSLRHLGTKIIETDGFILRQFCQDDAKDVYINWASDASSAKYNAWTIHRSLNETKAYLDDWISRYKNENYYHWAIVVKSTKEVIGSISVSNIKDRLLYCEVGYTIARKYWNKGIATEVLISILNYLTNDIGFKNIQALHDVRNKASGRVMEKAGMTYIRKQKQFFLNSDNIVMDCYVYRYILKNIK